MSNGSPTKCPKCQSPRAILHIKTELLAGTDISDASAEAVRLAGLTGCCVDFEFNEVSCTARPGDDPELLVTNYRLQMNSKNEYKIAYAAKTIGTSRK